MLFVQGVVYWKIENCYFNCRKFL